MGARQQATHQPKLMLSSLDRDQCLILVTDIYRSHKQIFTTEGLRRLPDDAGKLPELG